MSTLLQSYYMRLADAMTDSNVRLDDLYHMVVHIYGDKILDRSASATFLHFVEVCGMLTIHDRKKKREGIDVTDALCKSLGWYFPLLAKLRIKSVEELVFRKFPGVCPYCRQSPHQEVICKQVKGTNATVDHSAVVEIYDKNWENRPSSLDEWQQMFQKIYPRGVDEGGRSTIGLLEELGELAEAVRVFELHPEYFLGEAADIFSYIMGIANEHSIKLAKEDQEFSFQKEFMERYPGLCSQCGSKVCSCPSIPEATIGRMSKELAVYDPKSLFVDDPKAFAANGKKVAHNVLEAIGGYDQLISRIPFDRGDANRALVNICLKIADVVEGDQSEFAASLRSEAYQLSTSVSQAGSRKKDVKIDDLIAGLKVAWQELDEQSRTDIKSTGEMVEEIGELLDTTRVLFVFCSPSGSTHLRLANELRAINSSLRMGTHGNRIKMSNLPAATIQDLRRELLVNNYEIIHFSGHADNKVLMFEDEQGAQFPVELSAVADYINRQKSVRCVILNACESAKSLKNPISPITIGMDESIADKSAIEFSKGFYDALSVGRGIEDAYSEGVSAVRLSGERADFIKLIKSP